MIEAVPYVSTRGKGRNPPRLFSAPPPLQHHRRLGSAPIPAACGSWDMLGAIGGTGDQAATSRCFAFSSKKIFGLFQFGQSGTPVEFSADWAYACVLSEQRRLELGGSPTEAQLLANALQDTGSEPSAGYAAFRRLGLAPEEAWPTGSAFSPKELDLGGVLAGSLWMPEAAGFASVVAPPGPELTTAACAALMPFASGKRGQAMQISIASSTPAFDGVDGSRALVSGDFAGTAYDHAVALIGFAQASLLGLSVSVDESPSGLVFMLANSWATWGQGTKAPGGAPMPGCVWMSEKAMWGAADWSTLEEAAS